MFLYMEYNQETGVVTSDGKIIGCLAGGSRPGGEYLRVKFCGKQVYVHRLAFFLMTGEWPKSHVDHINGIKTDNRWCNLRLATMSQNKANEGIRESNSSGWKGVSFFLRREDEAHRKIRLPSRRSYGVSRRSQ